MNFKLEAPLKTKEKDRTRTEGSFRNQELHNPLINTSSKDLTGLVWAKTIPALDLNQPGKDLEVIPALYQYFHTSQKLVLDWIPTKTRLVWKLKKVPNTRLYSPGLKTL